MFKEGDNIDIAGTTVGKGFQGERTQQQQQQLQHTGRARGRGWVLHRQQAAVVCKHVPFGKSLCCHSSSSSGVSLP